MGDIEVVVAMGGEATATATNVGGATTVLVNDKNGNVVELLLSMGVCGVVLSLSAIANVVATVCVDAKVGAAVEAAFKLLRFMLLTVNTEVVVLYDVI